MAARQQAPERQLVVGSGVMARDGIAGTLKGVVLDPDTEEVADLIVSVPRVGPDRDVVLPLDHVVHADADGVIVDLTTEEVRALPPLETVRVRPPEEGWQGLPEYTPDVVLFWAPSTAVEAFVPPSVTPEPNVEGVRNIPPGTLALSADLDVTCHGKHVGRLERVLVDPTGHHATHLVVRRGVLGIDARLVPVSYVDQVNDTHVELRCEESDLEQMPRFRSE